MILKGWKWSGCFLVMVIAAMMSFGGVRAQVLTHDIPANRTLLLAEEQFNNGHYNVAAQSAKQCIREQQAVGLQAHATDMDKARFYYAVSGLKMDLAGSVPEAKSVVSETSNPAYRQRISFALAQYYFRHDELKEAIPLYEAANIANLNNTEIADSKFELAYCYFNDHQFNKALPLLLSVKEIKEGKYYMAGNYYYGLLVYNENKYKEALKSFERIRDAKEYRNIVPYYIAEIHYFMGNRTKAYQLADTLMKRKEKSFYDNELHLLAAQCLFEDQKYKEARPYFEYYYQHSTKIRKEDLYEMAYCDYRTDAWKDAIEKFKMLNSAKDSLGQTSMYLLGDCYLKTADMAGARNAFGFCADMAFNPGQQEASMMVYSKISYDMGYSDDALRQLKTLLKTFPHTHYEDEANTLISGLLVKTNNYAEALKHLEKVNVRDEYYKKTYQKATFGYAVQKFRDGDLEAAMKYFNSSLKYPVSEAYEAAAYFWKGELSYKLHHYADVISFSQEFVSKKTKPEEVEKVSPPATLQHAWLNMGFAAMDTKNYESAQNYFNQAQSVKSKDAYGGMLAILREADAVFMQKNYPRAITLYDKIIAKDTLDADYAMYQKGILLGLTRKNADKIATLQRLITEKHNSPYANYARYEIAVSYIDDDKFTPALSYLQQLTDSVRDKSFAPRSWMKTGYVYQQLNDNNKAILAYKHVVIDYPASEERVAALDALKNLYIQTNQPGAYSAMLKENKLPSDDSSSIDSTYYAAAEAQFENGKWDDALNAYTSYLKQFPNGIFAVKAHYYRAETNFQLKRNKEAMQDYDMILAGPWNDFSENSAGRAAYMAFTAKDYSSAYGYYQRLSNNTVNKETKELAYNGLIKSGFNAGKFGDVSNYADSLMAMPGISADEHDAALYYKARSMQEFDSLEGAVEAYQELSKNKNGEVAAESRYRIAEILLKQDNLESAEMAANDMIKQSAGYDYWIVKAYILMSDILVKQKDYFNARATLESIVKHTKIPEIKQEASKRLEEVKKLEKQKSKLSEE